MPPFDLPPLPPDSLLDSLRAHLCSPAAEVRKYESNLSNRTYAKLLGKLSVLHNGVDAKEKNEPTHAPANTYGTVAATSVGSDMATGPLVRIVYAQSVEFLEDTVSEYIPINSVALTLRPPHTRTP